MSIQSEALKGIIYQGIDEFQDHLQRELGQYEYLGGTLYFAEGERREAFWTENVWLNPIKITFRSISEAANSLRNIQRNWAPVLFTQFRRGMLIQEKLPPINLKERPFPWTVPEAPMGAWTLLDANTMIASPLCSSPFPGGKISFIENKVDPPSRAYLKLQEALVRSRRWPQSGERCLDAGACPGGWTWVLTQTGAQVIAIDRSPLDERLMQNPLVTYIKHDAFTLKPEEIGPVDWLFSDVICYPPRLYEWIQKWLASGLAKNYICTIKMQGEGDFETPKAFAAIPGSQVVHLNYNKHELTWIKLAPSET
jgi:23S rRNA (cytidine2498-2'-O)-methyltransferase